MNLSEGIKKIFLAGVGAVAVTGEKSKDLIDKLVVKGELTVEEGKKLTEELKKKADEKAETRAANQSESKIRNVLSTIEKLTESEREKLKSALDELDA